MLSDSNLETDGVLNDVAESTYVKCPFKDETASRKLSVTDREQAGFAAKVHVGKRPVDEEDDIISEDLSETCPQNSYVAGVTRMPSARQIKRKLKEKTTKNRRKQKVKYHIRSPRVDSEPEEEVVVGYTS